MYFLYRGCSNLGVGGGWVSTNPNVVRICKSVRIIGRSLRSQGRKKPFGILLKSKYKCTVYQHTGNLHNPKWGGDRSVGTGSNINRATGDIYIAAPYIGGDNNTYTTHIYAKMDGINVKEGTIVVYDFPLLTRDE